MDKPHNFNLKDMVLRLVYTSEYGRGLQDMADELDVHRKNVWRVCNRLIDSKLIKREKLSRVVRYVRN